MNRLHIALLALAASITTVACGGSEAPAKDPSTDQPATLPTAPENTPTPPPASEAPGLGGTGTGSGQGAGSPH